MKKLVCLLTVCALAGFASAQELIDNFGFETGDLTSWSSSDASVSMADAVEGTYGANLAGGDSYVSQDIFSKLTPSTDYEIGAWVRINSIADGSPTWGSLRLRGSEFGNLGTAEFEVSADRSMVGEWQLISTTWTSPADLSTLGSEFYVGITEFGIDADASVDTVSFVPEPASMSLLGLGALALIRRRR
jgi:hypothetical protein